MTSPLLPDLISRERGYPGCNPKTDENTLATTQLADWPPRTRATGGAFLAS